MGKPIRVLFVADSARSIRDALTQLQHDGYEVEQRRVQAERSFANALAAGQWDVVLFDRRCKKLSVRKAFELLGRSSLELPLIGLTDRDGVEWAQEAMKAGAGDYVFADGLARLAPAIEREMRAAEVRRELRTAGDPLDRRDQQFRQMRQIANEAVVMLDDQEMILYLNETAAEILAGRPAQFIGKTFRECSLPDTASVLARPVRQVIETGRSELHEDIVEVQGRQRVYKTTIQTVLDSTGNIGGAVIVTRDIFDRRADEAALRRRVELEQAATRISSRFVGPVDPSEAMQDTLRDFAELGGASSALMYRFRDEEGVLDRTHDWYAEGVNVRPEEYQSVAIDIITRSVQRIRDGGILQIRNISKAPRLTRAEKDKLAGLGVQSALAIPIRAGGTLAGLIVLTNVRNWDLWTDEDLCMLSVCSEIVGRALERKAVEEALQASEARFRAIFESAAIGIAVADMDLNILVANPALHRMLGYGTGELEGIRASKLSHPEDATPEQVLTEELIEPNRDHVSFEKRYVCRDGSIIWGRLTSSLVRNEAGEPKFIIGMIEDLTQRKKAEEQLRQAQKMEAIGQLAGGVAHDFRNQLTVIKGQGEMLLRRGLVGKQARHNIEQILAAADRSAALSSELLMLSRKEMLQPKVVDPKSILDGMSNSLAGLLGEDVALNFSIDEHVGNVRVDTAQLQQALVNLVTNAKDAMPNGGRAKIALANVDLASASSDYPAHIPPGSYVELTVGDTGAGMDAETQRRIFEPFFTTKPAGEGTGLGLSMVYGFAVQSGGYIAADSEPGSGTEFKIYLPRHDAAAETDEPVADSQTMQPGSGTVLVAEDERAVRQVVAQTMREAGYTVLEARSPQHALQMALAHDGTIDLLITDVVMPGMSGPALAEAITGPRGDTGVLYISGYAGKTLRTHGLIEHEVKLLNKPFSAKQLTQAVAAALGQAQKQSVGKDT